MRSQATVIAPPEREALHCPKCQGLMELVSYEGVTIDRCTGCRGMWFDANEQKQLKENKGAEVVDIGDPAMGRKMDKIHDITCPRCKLAMIRMVHVDQAPMDYEACPNCFGIFLDAGELRELKDCSMSEYLAGLFGPYKKA